MRKSLFNTLIIIIFITCCIFVLYSQIYLLFPIKHLDIIKKYSDEFSIDYKLILSIINVESSYDEKAVSKSDARGLMQLKLSTAQDMAKSLSDEKPTNEDLFNIELNIKYGTAYLRYLLNYYDNNILNSLCAYNAGLNNVNNWLNEHHLEKNENLTNIPFKETNNYINKIKRNYRIYKFYDKTGKI